MSCSKSTVRRDNPTKACTCRDCGDKARNQNMISPWCFDLKYFQINRPIILSSIQKRIMSDVAHLKSLLGVHPDFPKKVSSVFHFPPPIKRPTAVQPDPSLSPGDHLPRHFPPPPLPASFRGAHHAFHPPHLHQVPWLAPRRHCGSRRPWIPPRSHHCFEARSRFCACPQGR